MHIYDGMAVIRRAVDKDPMGRAPRSLITQALTPMAGDVHVWTFEGRNHLAKRRQLYPSYKDRPSTMNEGFFALLDLIRDAMKHTSALQIAVPGYEADDVIAHLVRHYAGKLPIKIHTVDRDLNQLLTFPDVTTTASPLAGVEPHYVRLYKTYVGDASDKIPGVRGFGDKTWGTCDKQALLTATHHLLENEPLADLFVEAGLQTKMVEKIIENANDVRTFWAITGFMPIDPKDVHENTTVGQFDAAAADAILKKYRH
jgi:hypothetical protein